ncbi:MAG: NAD+ synthase [Candidatus Hadarchaeales archaeon]
MSSVERKIENALKIDVKKAREKIVEFIKRKFESSKADGLVIGLSGGLDSSVCAFLSVEAVGNQKVLGVFIPEKGITQSADWKDVQKVADILKIEVREVEISEILKAFKMAIIGFDEKNVLAEANLKPRIRMTILYYYANLLNCLVVGASNKTELRIGYFTKFGDGASDITPIGCLYKTQVREMGRHLGVPESILKKTPTAGLWKGQTDEEEIGLPYDKLDRILVGEELGFSAEEISSAVGVDLDTVNRILDRIRRNRHKILPLQVPRL